MSFHELKLSGESEFADDDLKVLASVVHKYRLRDTKVFGHEKLHMEIKKCRYQKVPSSRSPSAQTLLCHSASPTQFLQSPKNKSLENNPAVTSQRFLLIKI